MRALHEYRREKSCNWCQCREIVHCPMKRISQFLCYSRGDRKNKSLCGISFHFSVPCPSSYMPRAVAAYKYNWYGSMHIQLFYFKYYIFWGIWWDRETGGRRQLHSRSVVRQNFLLGKIHGFKYENGTMAGISNLQDKPSLLIKEGTTAALFSHAVRDALTEQCFFWELKGNHAVCERTFA